jgi:hypothetical protein
MRRGIVCLFAAVLLAAPAAAQSQLPAELGEWRGAAAAVVDPPRLGALAGDDAVVLREYGIAGAERRSYTRGQQEEELVLTLYRMRDPTGAYGAYSYLRDSQMVAADLARFSAVGPDRALLVVGNLLVEARGNAILRQTTELRSIAALLASGADARPYPVLSHYLPTAGVVPHSDRFFLGPVALHRVLPLAEGDWLGFQAGAEAQLARYRVRGGEVTLLVASFPTPQSAARQLESLGQWFDVNPDQVPADGQAIFARRTGALVAVVSGARSAADAHALLEQVHHELNVTWNEPGWVAEEESFTVMLYQIFIGTGIILLAALVIAFAFGGFRLLVKKLFPGKVFDRPDQMQILQLGINSKPIDSKDFY